MEYGTEEYWEVLRNFLAVVVEEGKAGPFTEKGMMEDGIECLFRVVRALEPFGVQMTIRLEPIEKEEEEDGEDITETTEE